MNNFRQKFKSLSLKKKILIFNTYSIMLSVLFFLISLLIFPLFDYLFDGISIFKSLTDYLSSLGSYIIAITWGYTMASLALFTKLLSPKPKK